MDGVRVVRRGSTGPGEPTWGALEMTWAVSADRVGSRHVCGGWFALRARGTAILPGWGGESAWYVASGSVALRSARGDPAGFGRLRDGGFLRIPADRPIVFEADRDTRGLVLFGGGTRPEALPAARGADGGDPEAPWIAHVDTLASDIDYEPPLDMRWGVTDRLGGARMLCAARTLDPPRGRIQHHYHDGVEAIIFFLDGRFRMFDGPARSPIDVGPGDIAYIPPGTLHSYCSLEEHRMAEEVAFYGGVANKEDARTVFVEAPWSAPSQPLP